VWATRIVTAAAALLLAAVVWRLPANLGWVHLLAAVVEKPIDPQELAAAGKWFAVPAAGDALAAGTVVALSDDPGAAWDIWQADPPLPERLAHLGTVFANRDHLETAVIFYVGADQAAGRSLYVGRLCQRLRATVQPARVTAACQDWQTAGSGNLLVNAGPGYADAAGWQLIASTPGARGDLSVQSAAGAAMLALATRAPTATTNSLCQRIALRPDERVVFSARMRVAGGVPPAMRILYVGWRNAANRSQGNALRTMTGPLAWTDFTREYQLPPGAQSSVLFCPVEVEGTAAVELAEVRVVSLSD
jgi:hypothetical protein